jgi:hypothetical protein
VKAKGDNGGEKIQLHVNNRAMDTWFLTKDFKNYEFTIDAGASISEVMIEHFDNPESYQKYNAIIDYIIVNGEKYESEAPDVQSS